MDSSSTSSASAGSSNNSISQNQQNQDAVAKSSAVDQQTTNATPTAKARKGIHKRIIYNLIEFFC